MPNDPYTEALQQEAKLDQHRTNIHVAAQQLTEADEQRTKAITNCRDIARNAYADGMPELHIAREMRVNRRTVRRWLGKDTTTA